MLLFYPGANKQITPRYNHSSMLEIRHSVCALDCPDCCALLVAIDNEHATRLR